MVSRREYTKRAKEEATEGARPRGGEGDGRRRRMRPTVHAIAAAPWEAILPRAKKAKCDAIVMASHGRRGLAGLLLGSETTKVLTHSKLPVLVVR